MSKFFLVDDKDQLISQDNTTAAYDLVTEGAHHQFSLIFGLYNGY